LVFLRQNSRVDWSQFEERGNYWVKNNPGHHNFFKIRKDNNQIICKGYADTLRAWLCDGVAVEVDLLINI
jgi:hypothetical protein